MTGHIIWAENMEGRLVELWQQQVFLLHVSTEIQLPGNVIVLI